MKTRQLYQNVQKNRLFMKEISGMNTEEAAVKMIEDKDITVTESE